MALPPTDLNQPNCLESIAHSKMAVQLAFTKSSPFFYHQGSMLRKIFVSSLRINQPIIQPLSQLLFNRGLHTDAGNTSLPPEDKKSGPKTSPKPAKKPPTDAASMYPNLHEDVLKALSEAVSPKPYFNKSGGDDDATQDYATSIRGSFKCSNEECTGVGWNSNRVSILIRGYKDNGYNALVFNQRCKACEHFGTLTIDENAYVGRVRYRLLKFAGIPVKPPPFRRRVKTKDHESRLCEGCDQGHCVATYEGW